MVELKLSQRAQKIWSLIAGEKEIPLRQQALADLLSCSRRTIGRSLKELKDAGLLKDLNRRHANRCKIYAVIPAQACNENSPTPQGLIQLQSFPHLFECNLRDWPDWKNYYAAVTWEFKDTTCPHKLWRQTFDRLYVIRHRETGIPIPVVTYTAKYERREA